MSIEYDSFRFLNVDLDIRAQSGIDDLLKAFGSSISVLNHETKDFASIEIATEQPRSIESAIHLFFGLVQSLEHKERVIWDQCKSRCMNIGVQSVGPQPIIRLSEKTVSLLASIRAEVAFTVYEPGNSG